LHPEEGKLKKILRGQKRGQIQENKSDPFFPALPDGDIAVKGGHDLIVSPFDALMLELSKDVPLIPNCTIDSLTL
jgi:hypothetical protein